MILLKPEKSFFFTIALRKGSKQGPWPKRIYQNSGFATDARAFSLTGPDDANLKITRIQPGKRFIRFFERAVFSITTYLIFGFYFIVSGSRHFLVHVHRILVRAFFSIAYADYVCVNSERTPVSHLKDE